MTSDDVVHGFAIGQSDWTPLDLIPGEWVETTLVFDQPGEYTYYCTRWCGVNHWRMRGVIQVSGGDGGMPVIEEQPLFLELSIDLDAPHPAKNVPPERPDAERGAPLAERLPDFGRDEREVRSLSPEKLWNRLKGEAQVTGLSDQQIWDLVAFVYSRLPGGADLQAAEELYRQNCQACHGEQGRGNGVMVRGLPPMGDHAEMGRQAIRPPDFSDPAVLLGASPALLEGKITRGGMGTGMPYWGPILTRDQIQALAIYLYTYQMNLEGNP
jgi:mono/diheme cytochrome c family protein